jgi:non-ribosomal peptide synthetase component F
MRLLRIYGIFTSGTTGVPKCALNRHGGLAKRFAFMTRYFAATGDEIVLQNSGHTYDSSLWQLCWPLTTGGRTVLPVQGEFLNLHRTIDTIAHYGVTATDFVSSIFSALVATVDGDERAQRKLSCLRHVVVGGEEINPRAVHRMRELLPGLRVTNGYGPTETSIGMIFHPVSASDGETIPLGRPIDNCFAVIVDDELRPLPAGTVGEIAIGGACLGAGYHANPEATAAVFPPPPFLTSRLVIGSICPGISATSTTAACFTSPAARTSRSRWAGSGSSWARSRWRRRPALVSGKRSPWSRGRVRPGPWPCSPPVARR